MLKLIQGWFSLPDESPMCSFTLPDICKFHVLLMYRTQCELKNSLSDLEKKV